MNQCREQTALFQYINEVSFAINDMNLYLDTHPEDKKALAFMEEHVKMRKRALKEYAMKYGPLTIDTTDDRQTELFMGLGDAALAMGIIKLE